MRTSWFRSRIVAETNAQQLAYVQVRMWVRSNLIRRSLKFDRVRRFGVQKLINVKILRKSAQIVSPEKYGQRA